MPRGGERKGAGRPTKWKAGTTREDTKTVRIPKRIIDEVLQFAIQLDNDCVTQSKSFKNKAKEILYDESIIRSKDRGSAKKLLAALFDEDKSYFDKKK